MSRKKIDKNKKIPVGVKLPESLINMWNNFTKKINLTKNIILETALFHFLTALNEEQQFEAVMVYFREKMSGVTVVGPKEEQPPQNPTKM